MIKINYHTDPGHGWLEVPFELVFRLGIETKISSCSYVSKNRRAFFLEEDCDAGLFDSAMKSQGIDYEVNEIYHNNDAPCKRLNHVNPNLIKNLKAVK